MIALAPLLAAEFDSWPKLIAAGAITITAAIIGPVVAWALRRYRRLEHERDSLRRELHEMELQLQQMRNRTDPAREQLEDDLKESQYEKERLEKLFQRVNQKLRLAQQMKGLTWTAPPTGSPARFVPLRERRMPVVAVLNLKGGVGKTTLTANLGAAYARGGWRVLLVDLDLQASLTSLYLPGEQIQQFSDTKRLVQDYFEKCTGGGEVRFADYVHSSSEERASIIGSADTLAYVELNLTVHWLLRPEKKDVRLLLRELLHEAKLASRFDLVLIDCPPLLNVSCVNALAAADYVLIPVMPSKLVTDRVPAMIAWLQMLRQSLNADLKIIGVVANRTQRSTGPTAEERNLWAAILDQSHNAWGERVRLCATMIPQRVEVRNAENDRRPLNPGDEAFTFFQQLAVELSEQLPQASHPANRRTTSGAPS
ncbi:MAG TPA: AAA family ATPase [Gemmataceae bacterium]|nr:AAA family ATPase [Gemmataceae bacterium]